MHVVLNPLFEVVFDNAQGDMKHERTGQVAPPAFPFACSYSADAKATRREFTRLHFGAGCDQLPPLELVLGRAS